MSAPQPQETDMKPAPAAATTENQSSSNAAADDNLVCQWDKCGERCTSAEALYDHICEKHVGRKSTNNLNLTCGWNTCRTTTVKRDHITSHIRVHVPLKPHKCDFCGKAFKRPQDLKKHVKTHADDSVLVRTSADQHGYRPGHNGKPPGPFYDHGSQMHPGPPAGYGPGHAHPGYYAPQQQHPASYSQVYYGVGNHGADIGHHASYDTRKRQYEALNDFFGDVKRRQIDPTSYNQVGQRLMSLHGPLQGAGTIAEYMTAGPAAVSVGSHVGHGGPVPQHQYSLPMPNLRTKADLVTIDQFLEQMQGTVYENSNAAAAAGIQQPGVHSTHTGLNFRYSQSPPHVPSQYYGNHAVSSTSSSGLTAPVMSSSSSQSTHSGTPALTPPSSAMSYTSGQSPVSVPGLSPTSRHSSASSASYPTLPAVPSSYSPHTSAAPSSTLGTNLDNDSRRRYSGGMLQKSATPRHPDAMDLSDDTAVPSKDCPTPKAECPTPKAKETPSSAIDPALSGVSSPSQQSETDSAKDKAEEEWVENIRMIESLRKYVKERLDNHQYEEDQEDNDSKESAAAQSGGNDGLYPTLRTSE